MLFRSDAKIHVLSHSLHYGLSVFEGVRAYDTELGTAIFRLPEHTRRLLNSAKIFQMKVPFDAATLEEAQKAVVREIVVDTSRVAAESLFSRVKQLLRRD